MLPVPALIVLGCWIAFIVYWLASAGNVKAVAERKSFASSLAYRVPLVVGVALSVKFHLPCPLLMLPVTPFTVVTFWTGPVICVAGLCVAIWARRTLAGNWSRNVTFKEGHQLIRAGPYRFVRHPIYTGVLLMCLAPPIQFGRLHHWLGFAAICLGVWVKLKQEESVMLQHFPEYSGYRQEVKALVPFVV